MKIIGLTGPSGAGKGFCYPYFDKYNIPCIDTDDVYHKLLIPPSDCIDELVLNFGKSILDKDGGINRKELGNIVFSDKSHKKLDLLNHITHKYVLEKTQELVSEYKNENRLAVVIDAPLLFESNFDKYCDFSVAVISSEVIRIERIMARDAITKEAALMRIRSQNSDEFYTSRAKYVIVNNSDADALDTQLEEILTKENIISRKA